MTAVHLDSHTEARAHLKVTRVEDGVVPGRAISAPPSDALPADLVHLLIAKVGLDEAEVAAMGKEEAVARLQRFWIDGA